MSALDNMSAVEEEAAARNLEAKMQAAKQARAAAKGMVPQKGVFVAEFDTTVGKFKIEVNREWAPFGADRFHKLVKDKFFDDSAFFRVVPDFMVQFGLAANPEMTSKWDVNIKDDPVVKNNEPGFVTFAKTGLPDSRSTQIFINYGNNAHLNRDMFAPFGKVIEGMDVVRKISSVHAENPDQMAIKSQGNEYLKARFPALDYIKTARLIKDDIPDAAPGPAAVSTETEAINPE